MVSRPDIWAVLAARVRELAQAVEQLDLESDEAKENLERTLICLEYVYLNLIEFNLCAGVSPSVIFKACHLLLETLEHGLEPSSTTSPGRPAIDITPRHIENLMKLEFTTTEMVAILNVSRSTA